MRLRSVGACLIITLGVLVATATNALAWGNEGHQIVCQIAFDRLSPAGKMLLQSIQADLSNVQDPFRDCTAACVTLHPDDGRSMTFQVGCVWPDESRRDTFKDTYEYHFINVSNVFTEFSLERDCALLDCAVVGIQRFARYLTLPPGSSREKERRVLAVRFLGHFVGDLHQPLHVGFAEDLGGNTIKVKWKIGATSATTSTDLHAVWDNQILKRAGMTINAVATGDLSSRVFRVNTLCRIIDSPAKPPKPSANSFCARNFHAWERRRPLIQTRKPSAFSISSAAPKRRTIWRWRFPISRAW